MYEIPGATLDIIMKIDPVASVGNIAGSTSGLKKRNSSQTTSEIFEPIPRSEYKISIVCAIGRIS